MSRAYPAPRGLGQDGQMPILDLSSTIRYRPARPEVGLQVARKAALAAGWRGVVLPEAEVVGAKVYPVVEFTGADQRLRAGEGPQRCLATLEMWETWSDWGRGCGLTVREVPPAPLRIVGFVSLTSRWERALQSVCAVSGLGSGLVARSRRPRGLQLMDADASNVWVVGVDNYGAAVVWVRGRSGPVESAARVPATRLMEEGLFAHAVACAAII